MLDHFFPLLFPKDSEYLKIFDIWLWKMGAKRPLKGTSKVKRQTDGQTDRQTDISTFRKHRPRGSMLSKSRIPETKHLLNNWDSNTDTKKILLVRQNLRKTNFFVRQFYTHYKEKFLNLKQLLSITFHPRFWKSKKIGHWTSGSGGQKEA